MISKCPSCQKALNLTAEQSMKLEQTLARLEPDKLLTIKCPYCQFAIKLDKKGNSPQASENTVTPPAPPNLEWLSSGVFELEDKVEDVPTAMILYKPCKERDRICKAMESVGYQLIVLESFKEAMERMRFVNVACVVLQEEFEGPLSSSTFHQHMSQMAMERRRYIFYILVGSSFTTLYDLEALANSANLVVNTGDLEHMEIILRKAIPDYEQLFGPYMEELNAFGRR